MGTPERIKEMQTQGVSDQEIIQKLKEEGISPMEINDSFERAKIKEAVSKESPNSGMQPSIMQSAQTAPPKPQEEYSPQETIQEPANAQPQAPMHYEAQTQNYNQGYAPQDYYSQDQQTDYDDYNGQDYYSDQGYSSSPPTSTETIIEVAEQVFSEKIKDIEKEMNKLKEFKTIYQNKIDDLENITKRIQSMFDKMQIAILDKVGDFGKNITYLKKEIEMVEDTVTKLNKKK